MIINTETHTQSFFLYFPLTLDLLIFCVLFVYYMMSECVCTCVHVCVCLSVRERESGAIAALIDRSFHVPLSLSFTAGPLILFPPCHLLS